MIYKLNLPQMSECVLDGVEKRYLNHDTKQHTLDDYIYSAPVNEFIKPEYRKLGGFNWREFLIFYRKASTAILAHTDNPDPSTITTWAINWIHKGCGIMEYWYLEDIEKENTKPSKYDATTSIFICKPTTPPRLTYLLPPGAYLVNSSNVHRATGLYERYCVSYRTNIDTIPWSNIVNHFGNLVIGEAITVKNEFIVNVSI